MKFVALLFLISCLAVVGFGQNKTDATGKKQGPWVKYYEDGKTPLYTGTFQNDVPVGEFRYYYPNGKVKSIVRHETMSRAYAWFYFENEQVMSEGQYLRQKKDSIWKSFNAQGMLVSIETFKNNRLNGVKELYYLQNQLETGEMKVAQRETYVDSVLHGAYSAYFSSGIKKESGRYENGLKVGIWETFHTKGAVATRIKFRKGKAYGYAIAFDEEGNELYRSYYLEGKLLKGEELKKYFAQCEKNGISPEE